MEITFGGLASLIIFTSSQMGLLIWWLSGITKSLSVLDKKVEDISVAMIRLDMERYQKTDAARDFALRDSQIKALFDKMDDLKSIVNLKSSGDHYGH